MTKLHMYKRRAPCIKLKGTLKINEVVFVLICETCFISCYTCHRTKSNYNIQARIQKILKRAAQMVSKYQNEIGGQGANIYLFDITCKSDRGEGVLTTTVAPTLPLYIHA